LLGAEFDIIAKLFLRNDDGTYALASRVSVCDVEDLNNIGNVMFEMDALFKSNNRCQFPFTIAEFTTDISLTYKST